MTDSAAPRQPQAFAIWREAQDTRTRSTLGGIYYLLAWLLTWLFSTSPMSQLGLGLGIATLFALLLVLRLLHRLPHLPGLGPQRCYIVKTIPGTDESKARAA